MVRGFKPPFFRRTKKSESLIKDRKRTGVVLSGGFYHGAFQIGALLRLTEESIPIFYIVGSSVGAVNGAALSIGKVPQAVHTWRMITQEDIFQFNTVKFIRETLRNVKSGGLGPDGIFDHTPLRELFRNFGRPEDIIASPIPLDIITTNLQKREKEVFSSRDPRIARDPERIEEAILASCAIPIFFKPVVIDGCQYLDGGIVDNAPLSHAIKAGCDTIIFIDVSSSGGMIVRQKDRKRTLALPKEPQEFHGFNSIGLVVAEILTRTALEYDIRRAGEVNEDIEAFDAFRSWVLARHPLSSQQDHEQLKSYEARFSFLKKKKVQIVVVKPERLLPALSPFGKIDRDAIDGMIEYGYKLTGTVFKKAHLI